MSSEQSDEDLEDMLKKVTTDLRKEIIRAIDNIESADALLNILNDSMLSAALSAEKREKIRALRQRIADYISNLDDVGYFLLSRGLKHVDELDAAGLRELKSHITQLLA